MTFPPTALDVGDTIADEWVDAVTAGALQLGSNANGNWARFAAGVQVCWFRGERSLAIGSAYGSLFQGTLSFTFPQPFSALPHVSPGLSQWGSGRSWAMVSSSTLVSCVLGYIDTASRAAADTPVSYVAIGLWTP